MCFQPIKASLVQTSESPETVAGCHHSGCDVCSPSRVRAVTQVILQYCAYLPLGKIISWAQPLLLQECLIMHCVGRGANTTHNQTLIEEGVYSRELIFLNSQFYQHVQRHCASAYKIIDCKKKCKHLEKKKCFFSFTCDFFN